jgi:hypothetical protein
MRFLKFAFLAIFVITALASLPSSLFAQDAPDVPEDVTMLREAATALKPYNPELSAKVKNYADMESEELLGREGTEAEAAILKEAATALKGPNPDLAKKIAAFADRLLKIEEDEN